MKLEDIIKLSTTIDSALFVTNSKQANTVASVSVLFRSKEQGTRVKYRAKQGASKRGVFGEQTKKTSFPSFIFWLSFHFYRGQNRKFCSSVFVAPKPNGNAYYAGYISPSMDILSRNGRCLVDRGLRHSAGLQLRLCDVHFKTFNGINSFCLGCIKKRLLLVKATMLLVKGRLNLRVLLRGFVRHRLLNTV